MNLVEILEKSLAILLSSALLINAFYIKKRVGTWLVPGSIFSILWFCYTFFPLILLYDVPVNLYAQFYITIAVLLFSWTFIFFNWKSISSLRLKKFTNVALSVNRLNLFLALSIVVSIVAATLHLKEQGISLIDVFVTPINVASRYSNLRYELKIKPTIYNRVCLLFIYLSTVIGGYVYFLNNKKHIKRLSFFCFAPSLFVMLTQSAKGAFFLCIFLYIGVYYVFCHIQPSLSKISPKVLKRVFVIGLFFCTTVLMSLLSRGLAKATTLNVFVYKTKQLFNCYLLAHVYSFSDWFKAYTTDFKEGFYEVSNNYYGYYTFNSLTRYIPSERKYIRGIYEEFYRYKNDEFVTNVYTFFRGLILDFGLIGSLFFMVISGIIIHKLYSLFITNKYTLVTSVFLIFTIAYFGTSFLASLLAWGVIPVAFMTIIVVLFASKTRKSDI